MGGSKMPRRYRGSKDSPLPVPPVPVAPTNTLAPVVSGTLTAGSLLNCTAGTWDGSPTSYTYRWYRASSPITGAIFSTYTLTSTDENKTLYCAVTATNTVGPTTANSNSVFIPIPVGAGGSGLSAAQILLLLEEF